MNSIVNSELLMRATLAARTVVEIGCRAGNFGRIYLNRNPLAQYTRIDLNPAHIDNAAPHLTHAILGNVEDDTTLSMLDKAIGGRKIDLLIIDGVVEKLANPAKTLKAIHDRMSAVGRTIISVENIAHWSTFEKLLQGLWAQGSDGSQLTVAQHHFTASTARVLFESAGFVPKMISPRIIDREKTVHHGKQISKMAKALRLDPKDAYENAIARD